MKCILLPLLIFVTVPASAGDYDNHEDYSVRNQMAKMEGRERCLRAAKDFQWKGKTPPDSPLSSITGKIRVSGDFDKVRRKFVWDGNRIVMQRVIDPQWWVVRDCKKGLIKGEQCKTKFESELLWVSGRGILDKENAAMLGPAMDNIIVNVVSNSKLPIPFIQRRDEAAKKHVARVQAMYEACKGVTEKPAVDRMIAENQSRIETAYAVMGQHSHLYPRKKTVKAAK